MEKLPGVSYGEHSRLSNWLKWRMEQGLLIYYSPEKNEHDVGKSPFEDVFDEKIQHDTVQGEILASLARLFS